MVQSCWESDEPSGYRDADQVAGVASGSGILTLAAGNGIVHWRFINLMAAM